ncbi:MAG: hypothetical protein Q8914_12505, partial [Bacteroidota bacterium]|nr:hypothetical protein [Bacteroidota bacterium]
MTVLQPHHNKTSILKLCMTVYLLAASFNSYSQDTFDNSNLDAFNVTVKFDEIGSYVFPALYEDPNGLYLPVDALFNLLKIVNTPSSDGQVVKGYVETPDNAFEINLPERFVTFKGEKTKIDKGEATMDMGSVYLRSSVYERAFGFKISFNFRALLATFTSGFELPVIKLKKQEQAREKLNSKGESVAYDTILKRDYHWFKGGMFDWSVASSQAKGYTNETRVELGGGSEILGGETNIFLNASNVYGMKREQQQYSWRWANNDASLVRQIQLGRVNSRSIASLLSPVDGFVVSNTPTTVRKALGNYVISNYTSPDWYVELYVNNILTGYTKADASGFYSFAMPIVFGTSNITLRFYGPGGEMRSEEKTFNMPYNMMPKGEFEYRITGGELMDSLNSRYGRAEFSYGLFRTFTAGAGMEYLSSISTGPEIPFANFTFQPFSSMLITGEYAYNVRAKGTMNLTLPLHSTLELNYAKYTPGQKAIIYNYLEERSGSLSIPYRF